MKKLVFAVLVVMSVLASGCSAPEDTRRGPDDETIRQHARDAQKDLERQGN
jgi:hypothetical protein